MRRYFRFGFGFLGFICATWLAEAQQREMSIDDELQTGRAIARVFERSVHLNRDEELSALLSRIGQLLARHSDASLPVVVKAIDSDRINVFVLAGGSVYVTTGLIRAAATEAELGAALAHAVARVARRHAANSFGVGSLPDRFPPKVQMSAAYSSREDVEEADTLGLRYLYDAGYDPAAAVRMLQTVEVQLREERSPKFSLNFPSYMPSERLEGTPFPSHPAIPKRVETLQRSIRSLPPRSENVLTTSDFDRVRQTLE